MSQCMRQLAFKPLIQVGRNELTKITAKIETKRNVAAATHCSVKRDFV